MLLQVLEHNNLFVLIGFPEFSILRIFDVYIK